MYSVDYLTTFIPKLFKEHYEALNTHMFSGRDVVDLGTGPLPLLHDLAMKEGALSYRGVESDEAYVKKISQALLDDSLVHLGRIEDFLKQSFNPNTTLVCAGIDGDYVDVPELEKLLANHLEKGSRYLGVSSAMFMGERTTGRQFSDNGLHFFQNGEHVLVGQQEKLPEAICHTSWGIALGGHGKPFGDYDPDFPLPFID